MGHGRGVKSSCPVAVRAFCAGGAGAAPWCELEWDLGSGICSSSPSQAWERLTKVKFPTGNLKSVFGSQQLPVVFVGLQEGSNPHPWLGPVPEPQPNPERAQTPLTEWGRTRGCIPSGSLVPHNSTDLLSSSSQPRADWG